MGIGLSGEMRRELQRPVKFCNMHEDVRGRGRRPPQVVEIHDSEAGAGPSRA